MKSTLKREDYYAMVIKFANNKRNHFISRKFNATEVYGFCFNQASNITTGDEQRIFGYVDTILKELVDREYLKYDGMCYKPKNYIPIDIMWSIEKVEEVNDEKREEPKKTYISMSDYEKFDYTQFGTKLKQEGLLPPSYDKKPASVEIRLDNDCSVMVELVFKSKTSNSCRSIKACANNVYEYVNGSKFGKVSTSIGDIWHDFVERSMRSIDFNEEWKINKQITSIKNQVNKVGELETLKQQEKEFLREYINSTFCEFINSNIPYFVRYKMADDGAINIERIIPKTPRELELCVHKLDHDALIEEAESIEWFEGKCENIRDASVYETDDWDVTISGLVAFVSHYAEMERKYAKENGIDAEEDEM